MQKFNTRLTRVSKQILAKTLGVDYVVEGATNEALKRLSTRASNIPYPSVTSAAPSTPNYTRNSQANGSEGF
jgi:hypothetical protein